MYQDKNQQIKAYIEKCINSVIRNDIEEAKSCLQWLKENGGEIVNSLKHIQDINGNSVLHWATLQSTEMLNTVLQFAFNEDIDAPDKKHGETPLIWAIANDRFENVEILVVRGANINFVSKNGITILKAAQEHASSAMIKKVNEILTSHQMLSRFKLKNHSTLKDTIIFVSNSLLDGFREGDGDLMDKIVINLHQLGVNAIRVIENNQKIPDDRKNDLQTGGIITLSATSNEDLKTLQTKFLQTLDKFKDKRIILYIGSRIDAVVDKEKHNIVGSGSLYTDDFLNLLKKSGVKIVVCCLEFKFYKRSMKVLPICYEMLRQHLFHADMIHFLTEHDKSNFEKTLTVLKDTQLLRPHKGVICPISELPNLSVEIKQLGGNDKLDELKKNGVFISGIYTVDPLSYQQILQGEEVTEIKKNDLIIHKLNNRDNNILCLGLIRGNKGFEEAIALGKKFGEQKKSCQVFIVGRVMESGILLFRDMLVNMLDLTKNNVNKSLMRIFNENKHVYNISEDKLKSLSSDVAILTKVFQDNKESLNKFLQLVFNTLKLQNPEKGRYYSIHLNINEAQIHEIAMKCKYAIKLDHKGMANNASTIVSCLGLFLPTFTACGLVTGDEFRTPIQHQSSESLHTKDMGGYALTVIMPKKIYVSDNGEIKPKNFEISEIISIMDNDKLIYLQRLKQLIKLYESRLFDSMHVTQQLCEKLFIPVILNSQQRESIDLTRHDTSSVKIWKAQQGNTEFAQVHTEDKKEKEVRNDKESANNNVINDSNKSKPQSNQTTDDQEKAYAEGQTNSFKRN